MGDTPAFLTTAEVAEVCRTTETTVRWWRHVGRGPRYLKAPGSRRALYRRTDVEAWLESGAVGGAEVTANQPAAVASA